MFQRSFHGDRLVVRQQLHQELLFQLRSELLNQDDASVTTRKLLSIYKPPKTKDQSDEFKYPIRNKHSRLDMTWKLGTHLLMKSKQKDRLCKYLLKLSGLEPKLKEIKLMELTLVHMKLGLISEAYERLSSFIHLFPYSENPELLGYHGMLSFLIWNENKSNTRYYSIAIDFFRKSLEINPMNSIFCSLLVHIMVYHEEFEELERFLQSLMSNIPRQHNIFILRELCYLYKDHFQSDVLWIPLVFEICKKDPLFDMELIESVIRVFAIDQKKVDLNELLEALATRLEYDKDNEQVWYHLIILLERFSDQYNTDMWQGRLEWWPEFHQFPLAQHESQIRNDDISAYHYLWVLMVMPNQISLYDFRYNLNQKLSTLIDVVRAKFPPIST